MCSRPSARRTYSTKSVEFARRDLAGPVVEHLEPRRARDEMDAIAAEVGVRVAVAVVQRERSWRVRDGPFHDVAREQHALGRGVGRQPGFDEPAAHLRAADLHPDLGEHALRLIDDPVDELRGEHVQGRAHGSSWAWPRAYRTAVAARRSRPPDVLMAYAMAHDDHPNARPPRCRPARRLPRGRGLRVRLLGARRGDDGHPRRAVATTRRSATSRPATSRARRSWPTSTAG